MGAVFILGAPDPEMERIEALLLASGQRVVHAKSGGKRCHPGNAYKADPVDAKLPIVIECQPQFCHPVLRIDHHRPGDPGHGVVPAWFLPGSSIGQTISWLAVRGLLPGDWRTVFLSQPRTAAEGIGGMVHRGDTGWIVRSATDTGLRAWKVIPEDLVLAAAADHCPAAAYAGRCPGVDWLALKMWRVATRAKFQGRGEDEILADVDRAMRRVNAAPGILLSGCLVGRSMYEHAPNSRYSCDACDGDRFIVDLRGQVIPELPEALMLARRAALAGPLTDRDGRRKVVLLGAGEGTASGSGPVNAFFDWAKKQGLVDAYGDPARGYAGAYLTEDE